MTYWIAGYVFLALPWPGARVAYLVLGTAVLAFSFERARRLAIETRVRTLESTGKRSKVEERYLNWQRVRDALAARADAA